MNNKQDLHSGSLFLKYALIIVAVIILIVYASISIKSCVRNTNAKNLKESEKSSTVNNNIPNSIIIYPNGKEETSYPEISKSGKYYVTIKYIINLTPTWSEWYYINEDESVGFKESTVPYCAMDKVGRETCGNINEDVSSYFEERIPGQGYRFKSQANTGKIILKVWKPISTLP